MERLTAYLILWSVVALAGAALATTLGLTWIEAAAFLVPLFLVYAFVCLSAWYVSRAVPIRDSPPARLMGASALTAAIAAALWVAVADLWVSVLDAVPALESAAGRYERQLPLLFVVGVLLYLLALAVHYAFLGFEEAREAERRRLEAEVLMREAELRALRAQINPHFLYNSLNSISALTGSDPAGARRMCILLGDFLRQTLSVSGQDGIRLRDEIALADRFLEIEQVRFGSRLRVERHIDAQASECRVPPLILQPLIENAVAHGIAGLIEGGTIRVDVARLNGSLAIAIENPLDADAPENPRRGVGLENVRRRLAAMFGTAATIQTRSGPQSFRVELEVPWAIHD